ncbi:MAG TPA: NAD-dependent epimerase/dehydratase family protein [Terriglobia bacterium]|nr:NAD-dependent epimerase/dehydratase family protein [Terriglobia bacterium]
MSKNTAVIAGASGLVGGHCLKLLLDEPRYDTVLTLVRGPIPQVHPRLAQKIVDFDRLETLERTPVSDAFCALGTTMRQAGTRDQFRKVDFDYTLKVAQWSRAAGATQLALVSSVGADPRSRNFYLRTKGEIEEAIAGLSFASLHIFRPSILVGERRERRLAETLGIGVARGLQFLLVGGLRRYRPIPAATVASAMVAAVATGAPGRHVYHFDEMKALASRTSH